MCGKWGSVNQASAGNALRNIFSHARHAAYRQCAFARHEEASQQHYALEEERRS
jgi:hypothetical protein